MHSLKPHTALLVVCLLGQKLGDNVVSLSQLNAVSTFSYGKIFHKTFFHQNPGVFFAMSSLSSSGATSEASLACLPCVLRSPLGRCLTQQSTSFLVFWRMSVWGSEFKMAVSFSFELLVSVSGRWLETGVCGISGSDLLARNSKTQESLLFWHTLVIGRRSWWSLFKSQIILFGLCKSLSNSFKCETWEQWTSTERYENVTGSVLPKEETSKPKKE